MLKKCLFLIIMCFCLVGCQFTYDPESYTKEMKEADSRLERIKARQESLLELEQADSLQAFFDLENNIVSNGLETKEIVEKRRAWWVNKFFNKEFDTFSISNAEKREAILSGKWYLGMTKLDLYASIGLPQDINRTVGSFGTHEQLIYYSGGGLFYIKI